MIPKIVLNFVVDAKTTPAKGLQSTLDVMKQAKVNYIQVLLKNIETVEQLIEYSQLFKKFRSARYVDYTIWVDDHYESIAQVKPDVVAIIQAVREPSSPAQMVSEKGKKAVAVAAPYVDKLVAGIATKQEGIGYKALETWNYYGLEAYPDFTQLMSYNDEQLVEYNAEALKKMRAPQGMINGLERVLNDYKIVPKLGED